jgi:hypothetical protein
LFSRCSGLLLKWEWLDLIDRGSKRKPQIFLKIFK